ncbi:hypothetical protein [Nonomuraea soli]|uniref:Uncharacterized protein n=1 Tax=Nonomuraea soli TaxID=1032476 RepID=A0A7W0HVY7_9ACTN|nr:hypothetical protein [Nonomuraea soli]MBA2897655.1 hypothetical protein [Nonomuraea soli]
MTKPTTDRLSIDYGVHDVGSLASGAVDPRGDLTVSREIQAPARAHLPLTVWLAAADAESVSTCSAGCCQPVSGPLARQLVSACTRIGETVIHLGAANHQVVSAALSAGCLPVAVFADAGRAGVTWTRLARTHPGHDLEVIDLRITDPADREHSVLADLEGGAGLVVAELPCQQAPAAGVQRGSGIEAGVLDFAVMAGLLKPSGHLAVVTGLHRAGRVADPLPGIIARARAAGLVYLQHIIALCQPARGDYIEPHLPRRVRALRQELPECAGLPQSARAHSDVLLFTKPKTPASSPAPEPEPAESFGEPRDPATADPAGQER